MECRVKGYDVRVTNEEGCPRVRVSFRHNGECVIDTNRLSITGLVDMSEVFARVAPIAFAQMEQYWARVDREARRQSGRAQENA